MLNPFNQPELIKAEVFTELPEKYRDTRQTAHGQTQIDKVQK